MPSCATWSPPSGQRSATASPGRARGAPDRRVRGRPTSRRWPAAIRCCCSPRATSSGTRTWSRRTAPGTTAGPAPRPGAAAVDVRLDRVAQAGPALPRQRAGQRAQHRRLPRPARERRRDHLAAPALLLRPVGAAQPPAGRCDRRAHRPVGGRRLLLGARGAHRGHRPGRRPAHLCAARRRRLRRPGAARPAVAALPDPGRRPDGAGPGPRVRRAGRASAVSTCS